MKLIRFGETGSEKPGLLINGVRKDCSSHFTDWNREFLISGGMKELEKLLSSGIELPKVPKNERWGPCVARPGMILCIGLNYADHAKEASMELPKEPLVFGKATNTLCGPYDQVPIAKAATKVDYEVELAVILGKDVFELNNEKEALEAIAGYCAANDLSERAFQLEHGGQWIKGKSCPNFSPMGPFLATPEEIEDIFNLEMKLSLNGELRQKGNSKTMVFKPAYCIYYLSQFMKLEAGDIILTGTPPGVGMGFKPAKYIFAGDETELSIEGLGYQKTKYVSTK